MQVPSSECSSGSFINCKSMTARIKVGEDFMNLQARPLRSRRDAKEPDHGNPVQNSVQNNAAFQWVKIRYGRDHDMVAHDNAHAKRHAIHRTGMIG